MGVPFPAGRGVLLGGAVGALLLALPAAAQAEDKIAVVDFQAIFEAYEATEDAQRTYDRELKEWDETAKEMRARIDELADEIESQRLMLSEERLAFSFSGLKTAVRYHLLGPGKLQDAERPELSEQEVADVAASFQAAVIDCLAGKAELAMKQSGFQTLCVGGGVAANCRAFRAALLTALANSHDAPSQTIVVRDPAVGCLALAHRRACG